MPPITLNAVAFHQDGLWVAQCLEYNLVSCAERLEDGHGIRPQAFLGIQTCAAALLGDVRPSQSFDAA